MYTIVAMSLKTHVAGQVRTWGYLLDKDLQHVPGAMATDSPGGKARSPRSVAIETAVFNDLLLAQAKGETVDMESFFGDRMGAYEASCADTDGVRGAVSDSVNNLASWIESASEEDLLKEVTAPWGMKMTLADLLLHASAHMAYHSGQVNFVQLLHGDDAMHWM